MRDIAAAIPEEALMEHPGAIKAFISKRPEDIGDVPESILAAHPEIKDAALSAVMENISFNPLGLCVAPRLILSEHPEIVDMAVNAAERTLPFHVFKTKYMDAHPECDENLFGVGLSPDYEIIATYDGEGIAIQELEGNCCRRFVTRDDLELMKQDLEAQEQRLEMQDRNNPDISDR
jgi:hypothetical protein